MAQLVAIMALSKQHEMGGIKERNITKMHASINLKIEKAFCQLRIEQSLPKTLNANAKESRTLPLPKLTKQTSKGLVWDADAPSHLPPHISTEIDRFSQLPKELKDEEHARIFDFCFPETKEST